MHGPIALLLYSVHQVGATLDASFVIHNTGVPLDLLSTPYQNLKPLAMQIAADARMAYAATTRKALEGLKEIDREVLRKALAHRGEEDRRVLQHILSLSSQCNDTMFEAGQTDSRACEFCGAPVQTVHHLFHTCPFLEPERAKIRECMGSVSFDDFPKALLSGIPPAMANETEGPFWGGDWKTMVKPTAEAGARRRGGYWIILLSSRQVWGIFAEREPD